jgi:ribonuclease E
MGGVIVIDFIDLRLEKNRREVEKAVIAELKRDRARSKVLRMSPFGLMQITRQRVRERTKVALFDPCPACAGTGHVRSIPSMVPHVMRQVRLGVAKQGSRRVEVFLAPAAAQEIANLKRRELHEMEQEHKLTIAVISKLDFTPDQCQVISIADSGRKTTVAQGAWSRPPHPTPQGPSRQKPAHAGRGEPDRKTPQEPTPPEGDSKP